MKSRAARNRTRIAQAASSSPPTATVVSAERTSLASWMSVMLHTERSRGSAVARTEVDDRELAALPIELELRLDPYGVVTRRHHALLPAGLALLQSLRDAACAQPMPPARLVAPT